MCANRKRRCLCSVFGLTLLIQRGFIVAVRVKIVKQCHCSVVNLSPLKPRVER